MLFFVKMLKNLLKLIFPVLCYGCNELLLLNEKIICSSCRHDLPLTNHLQNQNNDTTKKFYGIIDIEFGASMLYFHKKGILEKLVEPALRPKLPVWNDALLPVDHRAKAYLDANCAHCHNLEGSAKNSGLYLSYTQTDSRKRGVFKPPIAAGKGSGDFIYDIVPGHPEESILIYRMKSKEPSIRMPEIGRSIAHTEGLNLLERYIKELAQDK